MLMKHRILFVDDEPKVLEALRRMLRKQRPEWDMEFVSGGSQALEQMARSPFDVVVSDIRMPGMDGTQLLTEIRERYPHTVRIILSGQYDGQALLGAVRVAHHHLNKPCDPDTLTATVQQACRLRDGFVATELNHDCQDPVCR
jgi:DNA-binding NtrC family response regulator